MVSPLRAITSPFKFHSINSSPSISRSVRPQSQWKQRDCHRRKEAFSLSFPHRRRRSLIADNVQMLPSDVCPTEDAIRVFLEILVDPLLPAKSSTRGTPSLDQQQSLAKQVQAAAILYNYYHRKQNLELDFLNFVPFCQLAVVLRPALLEYMNFIKRSDGFTLTDLENQISVTERAIRDACDICLSLDASKETPRTEGWPVSKVTVLLVDTQKENCWLPFGSVAQGVWGMIEKSVDEASQIHESTPKRRRITRRPMRDDPGVDQDALQQLAFLAVKEAAGIDMGALSVLESHVVYSLSKEKSVSRFYIMECNESPNANKPQNAKFTQVSIKNVINRLQGPLISWSENSWSTTPVVDYFLMLPYAGILSAWFYRKISPDGSKNVKVELGTLNFKQTEPLVKTEEGVSRSHGNGTTDGSGKMALGFSAAFPKKDNERNSRKVMSCDLSTVQVMDVDGDSLPKEDNYNKVLGVKRVHSATEKKIDQKYRDLIGLKNVSAQGELVENASQRDIPESNGEKNVGRNNPESNSEKNAGRNNIISATSFNDDDDDDRIPIENHALVIHQGYSKALDNVHAVLASREEDLSRTALSLLLSRRANLSVQLRKIEDVIALCDKDIHLIRNGGDDALALKLKLVIDACSNASLTSLTHDNSGLNLRTEKEMPSKVSRIEKNPCQELDDLCTENKWIFPTYRVSPCDGGLVATGTVKDADFEISEIGDPRPMPSEARKSAATRLLRKLKPLT